MKLGRHAVCAGCAALLPATLEAHWHIVDAATKTDEIGSAVFAAPLNGERYAAVARAFSMCLSSLADRLVEKLPVR
jgi:hypothetical protein